MYNFLSAPNAADFYGDMTRHTNVQSRISKVGCSVGAELVIAIDRNFVVLGWRLHKHSHCLSIKSRGFQFSRGVSQWFYTQHRHN